MNQELLRTNMVHLGLAKENDFDFEAMCRQEEEKQRRYEQMKQERIARAQAYRKLQEERRKWEEICNHSCDIFLRQSGLVLRDLKGSISSGELYQLYEQWCLEKEIPPRSIRALTLQIKNNIAVYGAYYTQNLPLPGGGHARGFRGIRKRTEADAADNTHNPLSTEQNTP